MNWRWSSHLQSLARLYGIQTEYQDVFGRRRVASPEALFAALKALHAPLKKPEEAPEALRLREEEIWQGVSEPVATAWDGRAVLTLRFPEALSKERVACGLRLENGAKREWSIRPAELRTVERKKFGRKTYFKKELPLPDLPYGYHQFFLEWPGSFHETLVLAAPRQAYLPPDHDLRQWGVFLPLYALSGEGGWGSGTFSDLKRLCEWTRKEGGHLVGTLPLLASFLDENFEPSPYSPVSRLFWDPFYLDVAALPEWKQSQTAQDLLESQKIQSELQQLRASGLVDYRKGMALKRQILEAVVKAFFEKGNPDRRKALAEFIRQNPLVEDYARFRAVSERFRKPWGEWPDRLKGGVIQEGDYDPAHFHYHLYTQWAADEQLKTISGLYLDLPLGVNANGFDVWHERESFVPEVRSGAPPDAVFTKGQDWGFPPLHPENIRKERYRYFIAAIRHHLKYASVLRIDHVMQFHRLFWIPAPFDAKEGLYVRYREEEFYAILSLESHRHRTLIVGENLGTVPPEVNRAMERHGLHKMFVMQYEFMTHPHLPLKRPDSATVASLNTHDMPPFTAFWRGLDIEERLSFGLLKKEGAQMERKFRRYLDLRITRILKRKGWLSEEENGISKALLRFLGESRSRAVLVNLEDLWSETAPQNIPGTSREYPNWHRKARFSFEAFTQKPEVITLLHQMRRWRKGE